ncbi:MAG: TadE/TadG family type IV pilus assembly protein [Rhodopila sp.]|nr:TadE/TadG family type IV pilus assembly protein [Rhodopila sp.]
MSTMMGFAAFRRHRRTTGARDDRAVAALEFAITAPILALVLAGASDYGWAMWSRSCLANAVAQGAYYAFLTGTSVTAPNVQAIIQKASSLSGVPAPTVSAPACYCPNGSPATLGPTVTCASTCADGSRPGTYLTITATYTLTSFLPTISGLGNRTVTDTVTVRLQ